MSDKRDHLNKFSKRITEPKSQGALQAILFVTGMIEADIQRVISAYLLHPIIVLNNPDKT